MSVESDPLLLYTKRNRVISRYIKNDTNRVKLESHTHTHFSRVNELGVEVEHLFKVLVSRRQKINPDSVGNKSITNFEVKHNTNIIMRRRTHLVGQIVV